MQAAIQPNNIGPAGNKVNIVNSFHATTIL